MDNNNCATKNEYKRETGINEGDIVMAIKTEPEVIVEHDETGKRLLELAVEEGDDGPTSSKIIKHGLAQTDEPDLFDFKPSPEIGIDPSQSLLFEKYFSIIEEPNVCKIITKREKISAKCLNCNKVVAGSLTVTSNFVRHMRKLHPEIYTGYEQLKQEAKLTSTKQDYFDKLVLTFFAKNKLPISVIESDSFKSLINYANPKLTVMCKSSFLKFVDTTFDTFKNNFKQVIKSSTYVSTTANIWSAKQRKLIDYAIHWLNDSFERKSVSIAHKHVIGANSFEAICSIIKEVHKEYALDNCNVVTTITDNGSDFLKEFLEFGIINEDNFLNKDEEVFEIGNDSTFYENVNLDYLFPNHIQCTSHTLTLIATKDFNEIMRSRKFCYENHKQILAKCSKLWAIVNRLKYAETITYILGSQLKIPMVTNWNSLYDSIKDLVSQRLKLSILCPQLGIEKFRDNEIDYLAEYVELLQPIAEALDFFQRDDSVLLGYLLPSLSTIITKYTQIRLSGRTNYMKTMAAEMIELVNIRFASYIALDKNVESAIVASVFCPAVKYLWVKALSPDYNLTTEAKIINKAKEAVVAIADKSQKEHQIPSRSSETNISIYFNFSVAETSGEQLCDTSSVAETEFLAYLTDTSKSLRMLNKYPLIKKAFLKYNTPLPSTATFEKLPLHYATMLNEPRREYLSDESSEKLVLLSVNNAL